MKSYNSRIALSVDLDDWYHTPLISGANFSRYRDVDHFFENWKGRYDYVTDPCMRLLDFLDKQELKITFFVIADMVDRYPQLMSRLKGSGHEIAHHSLHHTIPFNTKTKEITQSTKVWEAELIDAKKILESFFETEVIGYRAPGAYFADWMLPILIKHGFKYDSSLVFNSIYNKSNRDLSSFPGQPFYLDREFKESQDQQDALLELPWSNYEFGIWSLPGGGAFFFRLMGYQYFKRILSRQVKEGFGMFYIHALDLTDEKFPLSNFKNRPFYWMNKGTRTQKRLERLILHFKDDICTCNDIRKAIIK